MTTQKPNIAAAIEYAEQLLIAIQTAQACGEGNPIRLESMRLSVRNDRAILLDLLEEEHA